MEPMDPYKTILVVKNSDGQVVGRIPATAQNAAARLENLVSQYKELNVEYEIDENAGLLSLF